MSKAHIIRSRSLSSIVDSSVYASIYHASLPHQAPENSACSQDPRISLSENIVKTRSPKRQVNSEFVGLPSSPYATRLHVQVSNFVLRAAAFSCAVMNEEAKGERLNWLVEIYAHP